jgi:LPXTG-site transpeptidase (sortase) family protein
MLCALTIILDDTAVQFIQPVFFSGQVISKLPFTLKTQGVFARQGTSNLPIRLEIPVINVYANVESLGVTASGAMAVPEGPKDVAWFNLGPSPGQNGNAVIAGHEGWKDNIPAVFDNLHLLKKGDLIYTEDQTGSLTVFVVQSQETYGENDNAANVFSSIDVRAHLNLITCEGIWNPETKSYSSRLVVFADKE